MSDSPRTQGRADGVTIGFGSKFAHSRQFMAVFHEGMNLVEETAAYLDGDGREEARALAGKVALAYATESMRLTTRLMQLASWLLLHRAVNEGELTVEEARSEKNKVRLSAPVARPADQRPPALPTRLDDLIARARRLHERVVALDAMIYDRRAPAAPEENAILSQLGRLEKAFAAPERV